MNVPIREPAVIRQFRPDLPGNTFVRLLTVKVIASIQRSDPRTVAASFWPSDRTTLEIVERASVEPAMTTVTGWAAELVQHLVSDALQALGPASAGAEILKRGLVLNFDGTGAISIPGFVAEFGNAGFVAEGQPIPVKQLGVTPGLLQPHKLAAIAVLTREMAEGSNAEALIGDALMRAAGRMVDEVLFDANPGDAARPPGLRAGVAATAPSNNSDAREAALEDLAALINELAPVAGNGPYVFVGSPGRAALLGARSFENPNILIYGSSAVINDLLAIAPGALVAAMAPEPAVESSKAGTLVMQDINPPPVVGTAGPERSIFQTDSIALKMRWPLTWALRDPRGFAWMTPVWKAPIP
jgi:hypothetical protein